VGYIFLEFFNGASLAYPESGIEGAGKKKRNINARNLEETSSLISTRLGYERPWR
jgi:hypothetical protein